MSSGQAVAVVETRGQLTMLGSTRLQQNEWMRSNVVNLPRPQLDLLTSNRQFNSRVQRLEILAGGLHKLVVRLTIFIDFLNCITFIPKDADTDKRALLITRCLHNISRQDT